MATGYNVVDTLYAKKKNILVTNIPSYSTMSVVQMVFALIFEMFNKVDDHNNSVKAGKWQNSEDFSYCNSTQIEMAGKTIGIIGFGDIGIAVSMVAKAFKMNVVVYTRTAKPEYECENLRFAELNELIEVSDIVSLHCPLTDDTRGLINAQILDKMKPTGYLVNTSRGGLINENDLASALDKGDIAGAGLDVVSIEPILPSNPLLKASNCVMTPHIAWATFEARTRLMNVLGENIAGYIKGEPQNVVV